MHTEHFEQLKSTLNNLQKPVQELAALHARTLQSMSYIKPEEISRMQNPEEIWDRNIKLFIQNSHKALDFMQQAFNIFERHWMFMSDTIRSKTTEALQNGQSIARTMGSSIKSTSNGISRAKTTTAKKASKTTSASRKASGSSKTTTGKTTSASRTSSASRTASGLSKTTSARKTASSASKGTVKKIASKAKNTSKLARSTNGIAKTGSSIKKAVSAKKPTTAKKIVASKAKTTTAKKIAKSVTSKKIASGTSRTASRAKTTARPTTAKTSSSMNISRPGSSSSLMHGTNGGSKNGISTKPTSTASHTTARPGMQASKPMTSSMSSKDMSKPIINPSATVRDNKTMTSEHNKYGSMNIPSSHINRDNLPKK